MTKEKFSIRKTNRGAVSARIALVGLLAAIGLAGGTEVKADSATTSALSPKVASEHTAESASETKMDAVTLTNPVTYVADETKELGVSEVTQQGQEATEAIVTDQTKPTIEETVIETAQTEYVASEELETGKEIVIQEGQDAKEVTTTTYKVVAEEDLYNSVGSDKQIPDWYIKRVINKEYTRPYVIDNSQKRDSDKIVIDEEAIKADLAKLTTSDEWLGVLSWSFTSLNQYVEFNSKPTAIYFERHHLSEETVAHAKEQRLQFDAALDYLTKTYGQDQLAPHLPGYWFQTTETTYTLGLKEQGSDTLLHPYALTDNYAPTYTALAKAYLKHLNEQGVSYEVASPNELKIDGVTYQISYSKDEAITKTLEDLTADEIAQQIDKIVNRVQTVSETLAKRYDNARGDADNLPLVYETTQMTAEEKVWFEEKLASLPRGIKQNIAKVTIKDQGESLANGGQSTGMAYPYNNEIKLNYSQMGSKERLLKVFLHELSHVIDFNMGWASKSLEFSGLSSVSIYDTYFNPSIDKESPAVRPYYRDYVIESFAEFFSDYIMTRHFPEYKPVKFIEVDGEILTLRDMDWGMTPEEISQNRANYDNYYNDPKAYAPAVAAESFFADLYNKLFEQPTHEKVLIDQVKTETVPVRHRLVQVGTKPTIVEEETKYTTIEVKDENLMIGERKVVQTGRNGIKKIVTTYELVDKVTGQVVGKTQDEVVQELVQEIIAVGTKEKQTTTTQPSDLTPKTDQVQSDTPKGDSPQPTSPSTPASDSLRKGRNQFLLLLDQSPLTDQQKGELAVRAAFAETPADLEAVVARFAALTAGNANAGQTPAKTAPNNSSDSGLTSPASSAPGQTDKVLPNTGEKSSAYGLVGFSLLLASLGMVFKRRRSN